MKKLADLFSGYRLILSLIVFSVLLLGGFFVFAKLSGAGVQKVEIPPLPAASSAPAVQTAAQVAETVGTVPIGGAFSLTDQDGKAFSSDNMKGKYALVYFGFTMCPDVCPTGLTHLSDAYDLLPKPVQAKTRLVFVTLDPERDTPAVLKNYIKAFHESLIGLTGTPEQIKDVAKKYLVYAAKEAPKDAKDPKSYGMNHSAYVYLMGPDGAFVKHFPSSDAAQALAVGIGAVVK